MHFPAPCFPFKSAVAALLCSGLLALTSLDAAASSASVAAAQASVAAQASHVATQAAPATAQVRDHGVAVPVSISRGSFIVKGADGMQKVLVNLLDHSGGYGILMIDPQTGKSDFYPYPFKSWTGPFHSLYSRKGLFYGLFGGHFFEFDPAAGQFTFHQRNRDDLAMSMTEDDNGLIWVGTYPNAHLFSFDPQQKQLTDHGALNKEDWRQYPRLMAADDAGWVYAMIAFTRHQIIAFNPKDGEIRALIADADRTPGTGSVGSRKITHTMMGTGTLWRGVDGKVYARSPGKEERDWYRLYEGELERFRDNPTVEQQVEISFHQGATFHDFADGRKITELNMERRRLTVTAPDGQVRSIAFEYPTSGASVYSLHRGADGNIYGSTGHPMHFFRYNPSSDSIDYSPSIKGGHINSLASMGGHVYGAIYTDGVLVAHQLGVDDAGGVLRTRELDRAGGDVLRPFQLLPYKDGEHLLMTGSPGYGRTGGGMMIYNVKNGKKTVVPHTEIVEHQNTKALAILPDGSLIGGTSIEPGTGGQAIATQAQLYIMRWPSREITFSEVVLPGHMQFLELMPIGEDLVLGLATEGSAANGAVQRSDASTLFVFNWKTQQIVKQESLLEAYGRYTGGQASRVWEIGEDGKVYCLFQKCLIRIDPETFEHHKVADLPVAAAIGVGISDGRFYFAANSHLYSIALPYTIVEGKPCSQFVNCHHPCAVWPYQAACNGSVRHSLRLLKMAQFWYGDF